MPLLSTPLLARACRIFIAAAYPDGIASVPEHKHAFCEIPDDAPIQDYLNPATGGRGVCQQVSEDGYTFRLGSKDYPNLKLKVQCVAEAGVCRCVFAVDTHDAFSKEHSQPPADHPDAKEWIKLQRANRELKEKIESAWDAAGILTHNRLLRDQLDGPGPGSPARLAAEAVVPK